MPVCRTEDCHTNGVDQKCGSLSQPSDWAAEPKVPEGVGDATMVFEVVARREIWAVISPIWTRC